MVGLMATSSERAYATHWVTQVCCPHGRPLLIRASGGDTQTLKGRSGSGAITPKLRLCGAQQTVQLSSVAQSCPILCDRMDCSTPGLPVYYQLPDFAQTHLHQVSDAIQPSHPLLFPAPLTFNLSQHQGLF